MLSTLIHKLILVTTQYDRYDYTLHLHMRNLTQSEGSQGLKEQKRLWQPPYFLGSASVQLKETVNLWEG